MPGRDRLGALLGEVVLDVGIPVAVYYLARATGFGEVAALCGAAAVSGLRVVALAVVRRRLAGPAAFMTGLALVGIVLALISGDARVLLLKDSVPEAVCGLALLVSGLVRRPVLLAVLRRVRDRSAVDRLWSGSPDYRRAVLGLTFSWGAFFTGFACARIPVILLMPVDVAVVVVNAAFAVLFAVMLLTSLRGVRRVLSAADGPAHATASAG